MLPLELSEKLLSNKIIIIEDSNCAPGRGYVLARSLSNQLIKEKYIFEFFSEISPFNKLQECEENIGPKDLFEKTKDFKGGVLFIHSLTPTILTSTMKEMIHLLSKFINENNLQMSIY